MDVKRLIEERVLVLTGELADLDAKVTTIKDELAELRTALSALNRRKSGRKPSPPSNAPPRPGSIKSQILDVLTPTSSVGRPPITAGEINAAILIKTGRDVPRESFSPQLSRLVRAGKVLLVDGRYSLAPTATPSE